MEGHATPHTWATVFLLLLHTLAATGSSLTKISYSTSGKHCMYDCKNGTCRVSSTKYEPCTVGTEAAPTYYTLKFHQTQKSWEKEVCLSGCKSYGDAFNWCYIDEQDHWDICNPETRTKFVSGQFTTDYELCTDECKNQKGAHKARGSLLKACHIHGGGIKRCDPTKKSFIQVYTLSGKKCQGLCQKTTEGFKTCLVNGKKEQCIRPAGHIRKLHKLQADLLLHLDRTGHSGCSKAKYSHTELRRLKRCLFFEIDQHNPNSILEYASRLLDFELGVQTVTGNELITFPYNSTYQYTFMNPIFSYTQLVGDGPQDPVLPLVVRARITPLTLRPRGVRHLEGGYPAAVQQNMRRMGLIRDRGDNNNDEYGHLIGFQHGGPSEVYNFAPQTRRLNRGGGEGHSLWYDNDMNINDFVRNQQGTVELTIAVIYGNIENQNHPMPRRPTGFAVHEVWRNQDGTLHNTNNNNNCNAVYYNNDPDGYPEHD